MDVEFVIVGNELLLGFVVDSNSAVMAQALSAAGVRVTRRTTVPDEPDAVRQAVAEALGRTRFVLTTGGLGPTKDDLTKVAVAGLFEAPLEFRQEIWDELAARWARMGRKLAERNRCQAEVPRGAVVLANRWGTAPGLWLSGKPGEVIMLPGVPIEMKNLLTHEVMPRLAERTGGAVIRSLVVRTTGIPESVLADRIAAAEDAVAPLTLAYLPSLMGVDLRLTAWGLEPGEADRRLEESARRLEDVLGDHAYGRDGADLAAILLAACRERRRTLALAESCTGGMVAQRITEVPGSSDVFLGGVVAYANAVKQGALGVPERIFEAHGAVSAEAAEAMALGARSRLGADLAAAVTGIAGPDGGSAEKPVGLVWFAFADSRGVETVRHVFPGTRPEIRSR
ncbi:MAG TPA: competence/damage-inducible protein A, partial [Gemmatimonadales bacterium]|nr:competence/damage-inducible protein A [Gemmatimonadales bacterium]